MSMFLNSKSLFLNKNNKSLLCKYLVSYSQSASVKNVKEEPEKVLSKGTSTKLLKVAIIGTPNAGKSTLINQLVERRVFAISKKVHTTRCRARAVHVEDNVQLIFLDTPGLVSAQESAKYRLGPEFLADGEEAIIESDVIGVIHDVSNHYTRYNLNPKLLRLLHLYKQKESILILNKIDAMKSKRTLLDLATKLTGGQLRNYNKPVKWAPMSERIVQEIISKESHWNFFSDIFMVSALLGEGTEGLKKYFLNAAHPGEWLFEPDEFSDQTERTIIEAAVKSKLLEFLPNEIPYGLNVQLEYLDTDNPDMMHVVVLVGSPSARTKKLVVGQGGSRIRLVAREAEQALSETFLINVHLKLVVSDSLPVKKNVVPSKQR